MKKNQIDRIRYNMRCRGKLFKVMKITTFLLLVNLFALSATSSYSQKSKVSIAAKNSSIIEVLDQLKEASELTIMYSTDELDEAALINAEFEEAAIEDVLNHILKGQQVGYVVLDDKIIISHRRFVEEAQSSGQQNDIIHLKGKVVDVDGDPIPGVNVLIKGTTIGTITNFDGHYELDVPEGTDIIVFSFIGLKTEEVPFEDRARLNITMKSDDQGLEEVMVVAFGKQKKESVISSIETVDMKDLKVPSSNLTTAMAGRMSGMISYQRSGEPGADNAEFFIRGVTTFGYKTDPLILIDNIESSSDDLARMQPDDISSFSIMKDAAATALYGARGANGVILITTKEGFEGATTVSIRFENSISTPTSEVKLADPITYMKLHNEAIRTRDPLGILPYSQEKIAYTQDGVNQYVYPQTDWHDELFKDYSMNQRLNFNISGGGKVARFYLAASVTQDNGVLKVDNRNNFNNNIDLKRYNIRSNINMSLTNTTEAALKVVGSFDDYTGPIPGGTGLYNMAMQANPVLFPAYYPADEANAHKQYILFGNYDEGARYANPYAEMVRGYKDYSTTNMTFQFELSEDLKWITKGLKARVLGSTTRYSSFDVRRSYNPYYFNVRSYDINNDTYVLDPLNPESGTEYLTDPSGDKYISSTIYMESSISYDRLFNDKHNISGMLIYTMRNELITNTRDENNLQKSLPYRNMGLSGRFTYAFDSRYFTEFNFGYNGSERFDEKNRFGFFPSAGLGWIISNENFWTDGLSRHFTKLKLKGTYGLVGNDAIGDANDRFFYLANVNMSSGMDGAFFGKNLSEYKPGIGINRYANPDITWETATKLNVGIELGLWNTVEIQADYFKEDRENILMDRIMLASMGLQAGVRANVGMASAEGFDMSVDVNHFFNNDFWISGRANFTYAKSQFTQYEEPDYSETPWRSRMGYSIGQSWGYIAERLFVDEADVANSPMQTFGEYMAGDIKYKDINGDDKITSLDKVPIGFPETPEINYGFGVSLGYKGIDVSCFFQGSARSSFWIDPFKTAPFIDTNAGQWDDDGLIGNNALLDVYANDYWSEDNRNPYALWPRLDSRPNGNNMQRSTWFMQDGSFIRLKSVELGYSLPKRMIKSIGLENFRLYYSGSNLAIWSNFKLWDAEMGGKGLGYPIQKVHNIGLQVTF